MFVNAVVVVNDLAKQDTVSAVVEVTACGGTFCPTRARALCVLQGQVADLACTLGAALDEIRVASAP